MRYGKDAKVPSAFLSSTGTLQLALLNPFVLDRLTLGKLFAAQLDRYLLILLYTFACFQPHVS
jgi:hypothetical protein